MHKVPLAEPALLNPHGSPNVRALYAERLAKYTLALKNLDTQDDRTASARLGTAGVTAVFLYQGVMGHPTAYWGALFFATVFVILTIVHGRVAARVDRAKRQLAFYDAGLRRVEGRWAGTGMDGARFADPQHLYSGDLDIFGRGSLFELLCTTRTRAGEDCLAARLSSPAEPHAIVDAQTAVAELTPRLDLREDIALLGHAMRSRLHPEGLSAWGRQPIVLDSGPQRIVAIAIAAATVVTALLLATKHAGYVPFLVAITVGRMFERYLKPQVTSVVRAVQKTNSEFGFIAAMLARLEQESFEAPALRRLSAKLATNGKSASQQLERLTTMISCLDAVQNQAFILFAILLLWTTQCAYAIEGWRRQNGDEIGEWITVIGEFEALCALASYAYEHPGQPYPEIVTEEGGPFFDAVSLGHPLIPVDRLVTNDITLDAAKRLYIVSGSNMSGKSTLLRTIGINSVLANAGAPVLATSLRLQPRAIGTSITTNDSLGGGVSRFYAEITRLRQIVELSSSRPTLFLVDEILHGTNSHDRRIGAEAILRTLIRQGATGVATTHDLALAKIVEDPTLTAVNVHFEDQMQAGRMSFDHRLRPGVVEKSNALELMRAVGLEV